MSEAWTGRIETSGIGWRCAARAGHRLAQKKTPPESGRFMLVGFVDPDPKQTWTGGGLAQKKMRLHHSTALWSDPRFQRIDYFPPRRPQITEMLSRKFLDGKRGLDPKNVNRTVDTIAVL